MTLSTILGPRYEHPVRRMLLTAREEDNGKQQYLIFATKNVVGIQKMPIDGNPWKHTGLLGHPLEVELSSKNIRVIRDNINNII